MPPTTEIHERQSSAHIYTCSTELPGKETNRIGNAEPETEIHSNLILPVFEVHNQENRNGGHAKRRRVPTIRIIILFSKKSTCICTNVTCLSYGCLCEMRAVVSGEISRYLAA